MLAVLGKKIGAPWTSAALEKGMEAYPGQPTIRDLVELYHYRDIGKPTRFVGVTGLGEREFLTAGLMNEAFNKAALPHRVLPMAIGNLKPFRKIIDLVRLQGIAIEEDYYEQIHETAAWDESAKTPTLAADLMMPGDQGWIASNTLGHWAVAALEETLRQRDPEKEQPLQGRLIMLAGCGPLTRMIAPALKAKGAALVFASKDRTLAARMSQAFGGRQVAWEGIYATTHDVLIVSRDERLVDEDADAEQSMPIHPGYLKTSMTVLDLTTMPRRSPFLQEAKLRGCSIVAPSKLLIEQVREQVKRITGHEASSKELSDKLATWFDEEEV